MYRYSLIYYLSKNDTEHAARFLDGKKLGGKIVAVSVRLGFPLP